MTTYHINGGSRDSTETPLLYSRQQCFPANTSMLYMNPQVSFSATEANVSSVSPLMDIQDFSSWRAQTEDDNNGRNGFPLMSSCLTGQGLSLSLSSQILPGIHQNLPFRNNPNIDNNISRDEQSRGNNEFATQVFPGLTRTIHNSKYLKAAQELLDEAVNVKKALKKFQPEVNKNDLQERSGDVSQNLQNSITNPPPVEIPHAERQDLQNKLTKLLSILDEVDRTYKQYYQQMQIVVSSFDVIAGSGAAKPYTALALQTISRHFRSLRDAISGQIIATRKNLEEHDGTDGKGVGISRLRNVDQQVRQQRAMQQLGVMQPPHAWRPQRGLPDNSVSILRAWLFEHFLHPYPKDSDKIMLARQTGLSRGQVSNWFINARVRLWKPMVEEMYKEEFIDTLENDSNLSPEITPKPAEIRPASDQECSQDQQVGTSSKHNYGHESGGESCSMVQDTVTCSDQMMVVPQYHVTEMPRLGTSGVSLTLGLQNTESHGNVPMSEIREIDTYQDAIPGSHFGYINPSNRQHQLGSSQLLHDFVERYRTQV